MAKKEEKGYEIRVIVPKKLGDRLKDYMKETGEDQRSIVIPAVSNYIKRHRVDSFTNHSQ